MSAEQQAIQQSHQFDTTFDKYKGQTDRHQSQYIFVINGLVIEELIEKVKKMITVVDAGSNPSKKVYLKTKLNNFVENLLGVKPETKVEGIYFVSTSVGYFDLTSYWKDTLNSFGCTGMMVKYDDVYQLGWLKNLLLDRTYINILHFKNNTVKHVHLGITKKRVHQEKTEKKMDVQEYIKENTKSGEIVLIHGVSSFLKGVEENEFVRVLNGDKRDEELMEEFDKIINEKNAKELTWWLDHMLDPKEGKKLSFGKDIGEGIVGGMIRTVFCSPERQQKLLENYANENIQDKLIVVRSYGDDVGKRLVVEFKGAVGIKFY